MPSRMELIVERHSHVAFLAAIALDRFLSGSGRRNEFKWNKTQLNCVTFQTIKTFMSRHMTAQRSKQRLNLDPKRQRLRHCFCSALKISQFVFLCWLFTSVSICFRAVAILQPVRPCALIFCCGCCTLSHTITSLKALRPFTTINPSPSRLNSQAVSFSVLPLTLEGWSAGSHTQKKEKCGIVKHDGENAQSQAFLAR